MSKFKFSFFSLLITLVCCLGSIEASIAVDAQLYHTQDKKSLGASVKKSILHAEKSILIFTFSLSDPEIIVLLNQKANEGLRVTVVIDRDHLNEILSHKVPSIEVVTRATGEGHLHHKIMVVDENEIWIGSANFTKSAYEKQENLMVSFTSTSIAQYLHHEAEVFRKNSYRSEHGPLPISLLNQKLYFCLLPHDGFPPQKIEKSINNQSKQFLIEKINQANTSIRIAMMVWTNNDLANAVIQAHKRGVQVQVVAPDLGGNLPQLMTAGIDVRVNPKLSFMHNKLMCIDNTILVNGSANWSQSSFTRSDESFVVIEPLTLEQSEVLIDYWNYLYGVKPIQ
jgi:phosphatidylserine/phosphatidylglycerophosphate/cardiolipin synthase-like enzyme